MENQSGIGAVMGMGKAFFINRGVWFTLEPEFRVTSLMSFNSNIHQRLMAGGLKIGFYIQTKR